MVEPVNDNILNLVNELYNNLDAKDKIINEQALEIARLKERINDYENPDDMTLMFMWCDEKAKDKIKRLNNIINELERYINEEYIYDELGMKIFDASKLQDKLQELKGSDEE